MLFVCQDNAYTKFPWGQFPLGVKMAPRETENNTYAKFWGDKKGHYGVLWYFLHGVVNYDRYLGMLQTWKSTLSCNLQLSVNLFSVLSHGQLVFEWNKFNRPTATQVRIDRLLKTIYSWVMKCEIWNIVLGQSLVVERNSVLNGKKYHSDQSLY